MLYFIAHFLTERAETPYCFPIAVIDLFLINSSKTSFAGLAIFLFEIL